jgi:hypothetical protein
MMQNKNTAPKGDYFEDWLDEIRIKIYEEEKKLSAEELTTAREERFQRIQREFHLMTLAGRGDCFSRV